MEGENIQVRLDNIPFNCISEEGNVNISRAFSEEKIKDAIWDCEGLKSPEPDGYNFEFIKFTWDIVKADFVRAIQNFENSEVWPMGLNVSFIALIPKGVIDVRQVVVLEGRGLFDSVLITNEILEEAKRKKSSWVNAYLELVSVSILVNGSPTKESKLGKGLRQGD
ncbi:uncharacterized protein [Phaseolus vulgaris]|uniref:uncharacterized protein n=1 Tax=Phaseolus vulgaris TaxID=3885 RepID=UPI0035CB9A70